MTTFGKLRFVSSSDIGDLGPSGGLDVVYNWKWCYSVSGLVIWLVLIFAFIIPKANHNIRVLLLLIPLVIVNLLWMIFLKYTNMNSTDEQEFTLIFNSMAVAVTVLWLIGSYFVGLGGFVRFLLFSATAVIVASLGPRFYFAEFSSEMALFLALFVFMTLTMLAAITISRRLCGGKYRPVRFMLWLALWTVLNSFIATFGFLVVALAIFPSRPPFSETILIFVIAGSVFGLFLYVLNLPFMVLGFAHPFFRERFCACLRLKPMPVNTQNPGTEMPEKEDSA